MSSEGSRLTTGFDLSKFQEIFSKRDEEGKDLVFMARISEAAERYDDMCAIVKELVHWSDKNGHKLTIEERNLLSVAYKNVIGARRASWRTLNAECEGKDDPLLEEYKRQVEVELNDICSEILDLLENVLIKNNPEAEAPRVFYLKMAGDYYRYLAESVTDQGHDMQAADFYKKAYDLAQEKLQPTDPIRLGLALNYSVCFFEILKDKSKACDLAKAAFDHAISKLDKLEEADYKDSTLIMQLLRDNLTLWTSDDKEDGDGVTVHDISDDENNN